MPLPRGKILFYFLLHTAPVRDVSCRNYSCENENLVYSEPSVVPPAPHSAELQRFCEVVTISKSLLETAE